MADLCFCKLRRNRKGHRRGKKISLRAWKRGCFWFSASINHLLIRAYGNILCVGYSHILWWAAAAVTDDLAFYRGWFEVHIRPFSAWEENIPEEPQPQKSKERRHFGFVVFISSHCHGCKSIQKTRLLSSVFLIKLFLLFLFFSLLIVMLSVCVAHRSRWSTTTRRAGAVCRTVWRERTAQICWSGEEEAAVHTSARPQYCSWCCLLCDSLCSVVMMPSGSLFVCFPVCDSHVMRELIETERIYVEELLAVLLVRKKNTPPLPNFTIDLLMVKGPLVVLHLH